MTLRTFTLMLALTAAAAAPAERLPFEIFNTANGLPTDWVFSIHQDRNGFIWFATPEGLARYDGSRFVVFGQADGLPTSWTEDVLEARSGEFWVATRGAVCRFLAGASKFQCYPLPGRKMNRVHHLLETADGRIWCATYGSGLLRLDPREAAPELHRVEIEAGGPTNDSIRSLVAAGDGAVIASTSNGLRRILANDSFQKVGPPFDGLPLSADRDGTFWLAERNGTLRHIAISPDGSFQAKAVYRIRRPGEVSAGGSVLRTTDGTLWVEAFSAMLRMRRGCTSGTGESCFDLIGAAEGLPGYVGNGLAEDREGNLWIGADGGVARLARNGFSRYPLSGTVTVFEDREGNVWAPARRAITKLSGNQVETRDIPLPGFIRGLGWGRSQLNLRDRRGNWWIATAHGLLQFRPGAGGWPRAPAVAIYTKRDGLLGDEIFRIFEDSRGEIWVCTFDKSGISRIDPLTRRVESYGDLQGLPQNHGPSSLAEDEDGNIWAGFWEGGLARLRRGERRAEFFPPGNGIPEGTLASLLALPGVLWIGSERGGLARATSLSASQPRFASIAPDGLASDHIRTLTADGNGNLYLGTPKGIDVVTPGGKVVEHLSQRDGLPSGTVQSSGRDRQGGLWFASERGVAHMNIACCSRPRPPDVLITKLVVAGAGHGISPTGERCVGLHSLSHRQNSIQIEYGSASFAAGQKLRFQWRLNDSEWTAPSDERTVVLASLAPGTYAFEVRSVFDPAGSLSSAARLTFDIIPPFWLRWWFLLLVAGAVSATAYKAYSYRLSQLLAVERVRTSLASDLHDEIGSGLAEIAILTEVARQSKAPPEFDPLAHVSERARSLRESMSDIVWAVDPRRDHMSDLIVRMRQFAFVLLEADGCEVRFETFAEREWSTAAIASERRRHILLIFKEALVNAAKHAHATTVVVRVGIQAGSFSFIVQDNGRGFDVTAEPSGHGLRNMRLRAEQIGGNLNITSEPGCTMIAFEVATRVRTRMNVRLTGHVPRT